MGPRADNRANEVRRPPRRWTSSAVAAHQLHRAPADGEGSSDGQSLQEIRNASYDDKVEGQCEHGAPAVTSDSLPSDSQQVASEAWTIKDIGIGSQDCVEPVWINEATLRAKLGGILPVYRNRHRPIRPQLVIDWPANSSASADVGKLEAGRSSSQSPGRGTNQDRKVSCWARLFDEATPARAGAKHQASNPEANLEVSHRRAPHAQLQAGTAPRHSADAKALSNAQTAEKGLPSVSTAKTHTEKKDAVAKGKRHFGSRTSAMVTQPSPGELLATSSCRGSCGARRTWLAAAGPAEADDGEQMSWDDQAEAKEENEKEEEEDEEHEAEQEDDEYSGLSWCLAGVGNQFAHDQPYRRCSSESRRVTFAEHGNRICKNSI